MLRIGLLHLVIIVQIFPLHPKSLQDFYHEDMLDFCQRLFQSQWDDRVGFFLIFLYDGLHQQIFIYWTIPASLEWSLLYYHVWSFWCVLIFGLPIFYWVVLNQCSWRKFPLSSLYMVWKSEWLYPHKMNLAMFLLFYFKE